MDAFEELRILCKEAGIMGKVTEFLYWDLQTMMPKNGAKYRIPQIETATSITHKLATNPRIGELITQLETKHKEQKVSAEEQAYLREIKNSYTRAVKVPQSLVERQATVYSRGEAIWKEARSKSDFSLFKDTLEEIFSLTKAYALAINPTQDIYTTLLEADDYDLTHEDIKMYLYEVKDALVPLLTPIQYLVLLYKAKLFSKYSNSLPNVYDPSSIIFSILFIISFLIFLV